MTGRALGSRQFHVGPLASADCSPGIPDGDALYLVRSRFQSLRGGVNDVGFHPLPIGDAAKCLADPAMPLHVLAGNPTLAEAMATIMNELADGKGTPEEIEATMKLYCNEDSP